MTGLPGILRKTFFFQGTQQASCSCCIDILANALIDHIYSTGLDSCVNLGHFSDLSLQTNCLVLLPGKCYLKTLRIKQYIYQEIYTRNSCQLGTEQIY